MTDDEQRVLLNTPWGVHGIPSPAQLAQMNRFTLTDVNSLIALPQVQAGGWAAVARLGSSTAAPVAELVALAQSAIGGLLPDLEAIVRLSVRFTVAQVTQLAPKVPAHGWAGLVRLAALTRPAADLIALANSSLGGSQPDLETMEALDKFTHAQILSIVTSPANNHSFENWNDLRHLAEIRDTAANLTILGQNSDLAARPWLETQVHSMRQAGVHGQKQDVTGLLDRARSCWSWATQGFVDRPGGFEQVIWEYFGRRVNINQFWAHPLGHPAARDTVTNVGAFRAYLDSRQAQLNAIVVSFQGPAGLNPQNMAAQRSMMELVLTDSGFEVLPPNATSRWYICMHTPQNSASWDHWWIKTRQGDIIETFPFRATDNFGDSLYFQGAVNDGNLATDFRHEVPVRDLLPTQKAIIKREALRSGRQFTDDLP